VLDDKTFWDLIARFDWKQSGDDDAVLQPAVDALAAMPEADIQRFDDLLAEKLYAIDTREHARHLFAAEADVDDGDTHISADEFLYGRCVVVANGRALYEKVLADPGSIPTGLEFEALLYLASAAFEKRTNREYDHVPSVSWESFSNKAGWKPTEHTKPGRFTGDSVPPGNRRPT
jgi:hypothetical protein